MLTLTSSTRSGRRAFLTAGSLALGGFTLPQLLAAKASAAESGRPIKDKSVIFLFLHGGPSQIETFDPKMTAPPGIHSVTGEIPTALPGITFGSTFERLAALANRTAIVRSFTTGDGKHDIKPIVGKNSADANLGSLYALVAGSNRPDTGMPTNVALFPRSVDPERQPRQKQFGDFGATGSLGAAFTPFIPGSGGDMQSNMELKLPRQRIDDRRSLLTGLDRIRREADKTALQDGLDRFRQQAFDTILGGAAEAFDLSKEDPRTLARYDTAPLVRPGDINPKWNNKKFYVDNAKTLGKLLLMARRLCEAGAGFVTVTTNFVWDMHSDVNNAGVEEGMRYMGRPLDHAVSAFLEDVDQRGLSDDILLVACGEMGRTPRLNNRGGRDHWGGLAPLLLAGGGLKMGQVIGQSTRDAGAPLSTPYTLNHLTATILHTLLDTGQLRVTRGVPREVARIIETGEVIPELF
jgi:hypothetical protein